MGWGCKQGVVAMIESQSEKKDMNMVNNKRKMEKGNAGDGATESAAAKAYYWPMSERDPCVCRG